MKLSQILPASKGMPATSSVKLEVYAEDLAALYPLHIVQEACVRARQANVFFPALAELIDHCGAAQAAARYNTDRDTDDWRVKIINGKRYRLPDDASPPSWLADKPSPHSPQGWDAPGVRSKPALAAMMRMLSAALARKDHAMLDELESVGKLPDTWPAWLDKNGDDGWKEHRNSTASGQI